jgi:hypothetical protein
MVARWRRFAAPSPLRSLQWHAWSGLGINPTESPRQTRPLPMRHDPPMSGQSLCHQQPATVFPPSRIRHTSPAPAGGLVSVGVGMIAFGLIADALVFRVVAGSSTQCSARRSCLTLELSEVATTGGEYYDHYHRQIRARYLELAGSRRGISLKLAECVVDRIAEHYLKNVATVEDTAGKLRKRGVQI